MLSSPEVFIEGDHDYGDDLMMDMACWLCNHLLPDIGYQIVITFRKFDEEDDSPAQGFHLSFDKDYLKIPVEIIISTLVRRHSYHGCTGIVSNFYFIYLIDYLILLSLIFL